MGGGGSTYQSVTYFTVSKTRGGWVTERSERRTGGLPRARGVCIYITLGVCGHFCESCVGLGLCVCDQAPLLGWWPACVWGGGYWFLSPPTLAGRMNGSLAPPSSVLRLNPSIWIPKEDDKQRSPFQATRSMRSNHAALAVVVRGGM